MSTLILVNDLEDDGFSFGFTVSRLVAIPVMHLMLETACDVVEFVVCELDAGFPDHPRASSLLSAFSTLSLSFPISFVSTRPFLLKDLQLQSSDAHVLRRHPELQLEAATRKRRVVSTNRR